MSPGKREAKTIEKPAGVLVCGTNYGRIYVEAIAASRGVFRLAGILARGSERSVKLAKRLEAPLFRRVDQLPADILIACVAVGKSSTPGLVEALLDRQIHILCEHPQDPDFLESALDRADEEGLRFFVNGHFGELCAAAAFSRESSRLCRLSRPVYADIMCSDRSLYAAIDILRRALGELRTVTVRGAWKSGFMDCFTATVDGIPAMWRVQSSGQLGEDMPDRSRDYLIDTRISIVFSGGVLSLMGVAGPVIWNRCYNQVAASENLYRQIDGTAAESGRELWQARIEANIGTLKGLRSAAEGGPTPPEQTREHVLEVGKCWETVGRRMAG